MNKKNYILFSLSLLLFNCTVKVEDVKRNTSNANNGIPEQENAVKAVLWCQLSAEYKALSYQAYNLAKIQLDEALNIKSYEKPLALVTDIDETLLDNSPYLGKMISLDQGYSKDKWMEWGKLKNAKALPGAKEFLNYAASKEVQIFYISNRYVEQLEETLENLKNLELPVASDEHVMLKSTTSGKASRRANVLKDYEVVMLLGDNLSDFSEVFDDNSSEVRHKLVDSLRLEFGKKFIVLPNPMYGDWEVDGLYDGTYDWNAEQRDSIRKTKLISYEYPTRIQ